MTTTHTIDVIDARRYTHLVRRETATGSRSALNSLDRETGEWFVTGAWMRANRRSPVLSPRGVEHLNGLVAEARVAGRVETR